MLEPIQALINYVLGLVQAHPGLTCLVILAMALASIISSSLPAPEEIWPNKLGGWYFLYLTFYRILHTVAWNFGNVFTWIKGAVSGWLKTAVK
jgi:hypothetical protein